MVLVIGVPLSIMVGYGSKQLLKDAALPYIDAATTTFGLIATYLEAHKYLSAWLFWIVLNLASAIIYYSKGWYIYAPLMMVYFGFSIVGFYSWRKLVVETSTR